MDLNAEASRPEDGWIDQIETVRGAHQNYPRKLFSAVKLREKPVDAALGGHGTRVLSADRTDRAGRIEKIVKSAGIGHDASLCGPVKIPSARSPIRNRRRMSRIAISAPQKFVPVNFFVRSDVMT